MHNRSDDEEDILRRALLGAFPDDCARVGKTNLADIVRFRGDVQLVELGAPSPLDWSVSLSLLAAAAAIGNHVLSIWKTTRSAPKKDQKEVALEVKLSLPPELAEKLKPADLERILDSLSKCAAPQDSGREQ